MNLYKIYINSVSGKFDRIAMAKGWKLGINTRYRRNAPSVFMVDDDWKHPEEFNRKNHVEYIKKQQPYMAVTREIEPFVDQREVIEIMEEIQPYCHHVITIPKMQIIDSKLLAKDNNIILGIPLGSGYSDWAWYYAETTHLPLHLLGGSPKHWIKAIQHFGQHRIHSLDGNYLSKIANYGQIYIDFVARKPNSYEVEAGADFNYRCFSYSLNWVNQLLDAYPRLSKNSIRLLN